MGYLIALIVLVVLVYMYYYPPSWIVSWGMPRAAAPAVPVAATGPAGIPADTASNTLQSFSAHRLRDEGFWPKLGQVMGSENAGASDSFSTNPGVGTFVQGYARPSSLPSTMPLSVYLQGA